MAEKIFTYEFDGLKFQVILTEENGVVSAQIKVTEGWADFNAFYWGDDNHSGPSEKLADKNLNMNGEGSQYTDEDGNTTNVQWDGAQKLSDVGLGGKKTSNIVSEGETSQAFVLNGVSSLDDIDFFGVRATSVNGSGSIKGVATPDEPEDPEEPDDHFPEWDQPSISHITLYWRDDDVLDDSKGTPTIGSGGKGGSNEPDGWFTVKFNYSSDSEFADWFANGLSNDLDDNLDDFLNFLVSEGAITAAHKDSLVGVAIKGGQSGEVWYDLDNDPDDTDTPPNDIADYPIEQKELDLAYNWDATNDEWTIA
ncbi:MAG: hypothetical protein K5872_05205 [Rhizobiaceae bacterium]|nr:hypothetical protein [Rhizobiaceae bacterium]MCV0405608.1 hypothetical protein [Rhizobiaceae bacterium]